MLTRDLFAVDNQPGIGDPVRVGNPRMLQRNSMGEENSVMSKCQ